MSKGKRRNKRREIVYRIKVDWDVWKRDESHVDAFAHVTFYTFDGPQRFALTPNMMASMPGVVGEGVQQAQA